VLSSADALDSNLVSTQSRKRAGQYAKRWVRSDGPLPKRPGVRARPNVPGNLIALGPRLVTGNALFDHFPLSARRSDIHEEASVKAGARRSRDFTDIHSASSAMAGRHEQVCGRSHSTPRRRDAPRGTSGCGLGPATDLNLARLLPAGPVRPGPIHSNHRHPGHVSPGVRSSAKSLGLLLSLQTSSGEGSSGVAAGKRDELLTESCRQRFGGFVPSALEGGLSKGGHDPRQRCVLRGEVIGIVGSLAAPPLPHRGDFPTSSRSSKCGVSSRPPAHTIP
jgi:hypothetical protein